MKVQFLLKTCLSFVMLFSSAVAQANKAPSPRLTKEQIRIQQGVDDCKTKKPTAQCHTMESKGGTCQWFVWWWSPTSSEKAFENGKMEFSSYLTQCSLIDKLIPSKKDPAVQVKANKCLICM